MACLVTGASGFLGGRVAQMLHERGEELVILARANSDLSHLASLPKRTVRGDLSNQAALQEAVAGVKTIFHCAACSTDWAPKRTYQEANVGGTQNLLDAARAAPGLKRFLHVSTTDIYGYPHTPCDEEHLPVDAGLPYNQSKILGEAAVWRSYREHGLPVTVVRPATIYGPRGKDFTREVATLLRQGVMAYIDAGAAPGGFVYVDTVAEGMLDAAESAHTLGQAYNISGGTGATWKQYATLFAEQLAVKPPWINLPFSAAMTLARTMETAYGFLGVRSRPLLTRHAVYLLARDQEFPIEKASRAFGYAPRISLEEGIRRSVAWLRENDLK
ncbi:MAG: NAD-dependent epimerase/dehydratase family protein [Acidobacteriaceae bacterium]